MINGITLTNTLTKAKEKFTPLVPGKVSIYCCGVTVYDLCHLGHARSYIVWDVLRRNFMWQGYEVTFVQNYTDIDDKIIAKANSEGTTIEVITERNIKAFEDDMGALNILPADKMPRVTRSLDAIRAMIKDLADKGFAYSMGGDMYFSVMGFKWYGKLSGRNLGQQQVNSDPKKGHPFDFALWKGARASEPGFPSPWGWGRPGWHIECSTMIREELGETIDIHLGGADLIFPHHENEIAQSEVANGAELARYWLHNGFVSVGEEKMAKSLGNFTTIRDLIGSGISPMTIRLFVLQAHYRKPIDFNSEAMIPAINGWKVLNAALGFGWHGISQHGDSWHGASRNGIGQHGDGQQTDKPLILTTDLKNSRDRFISALNDDLNTSVAISELFYLARPIVSAGDENREILNRWGLLHELAGILGLVHEVSEPQKPKSDEIQALIEMRNIARANRDFKEADRLRELLVSEGIMISDGRVSG